jgi:hypothetical protein
MPAVVAALITFAISFALLSVVEKLIHKLTKNPDKSYQLGVWLFSLLLAAYVLMDYLGR